jgi:hypothetical protein
VRSFDGSGNGVEAAAGSAAGGGSGPLAVDDDETDDAATGDAGGVRIEWAGRCAAAEPNVAGRHRRKMKQAASGPQKYLQRWEVEGGPSWAWPESWA